MEIKIFYSWQSDIKAAANRTLIQTALERAAKDIRDDNSIQVEPVIDRDTSGVPGSPDIGSTIFNKIDASDVFVADVTIVNKLSDTRAIPNPNVLIELGYALKAVGDNKIIFVQNTEFGGPELLPFDLRQKRVLTYNSPDKTDSRVKERNHLQKRFREMISLMVQKIEKKPASDYPIDLSIDYKDIKIESKRHDYQLQVSIKNEGQKNISEWHVDVMFPTNILDPTVNYGLAVNERSDHNITFFRSSQETHPGVLYPGDTKIIMTIDYYIDTQIFRFRGDLFQTEVTAVSYVHGQQAASAAKRVADMQNF